MELTSPDVAAFFTSRRVPRLTASPIPEHFHGSGNRGQNFLRY